KREAMTPTATASLSKVSKLKWRLCPANGHWYGRDNPYRIDEDPRVGALAELIPLKTGRRRTGWTICVGGHYVNTHGRLLGAKQRAEQGLAKTHLSRSLTSQQSHTSGPHNRLELRHGQEWRPAQVLGHCGTHLHV